MSLVWLGLTLLLGQDRRQVLADLEKFDGQIDTLSTQITALDERAATLDATRAEHAAAVAQAEQDLAARREEAGRRLRTFYRLKRRGIARLVFDSESPIELRRRVRYLLALIRADEGKTREYVTLVDQRKAAGAQVESDVAALAGVQADLKARLASLEAEKNKRLSLLHDIRSRPELATAVLRERGEAALALDHAVQATTSAAPVGAGDAASFRASKGRLPPPLTAPLRRRFGPYVDEASGLPANNLGVDFAAALGTPFRTVADGVVTRSGYLRGYGQMVMVQHGAYTTLYAHANGLRVAQGQAVHEGDVLGLVGNTGLAEDAEAELHFEIRYNNTPQDPGEWLAHVR